ncbi:ferrous iron transporter B [bacterium]|nr:ferrous iron transporter B [bacterium]
MGMTADTMGARTNMLGEAVIKRHADDLIIALAGNPNVGKSTVFNALTGLRQHTGNWPGKTVGSAQGYCEHGGQGFVLVDLPGTYSLCAHSQEEEITRDFILSGEADVTVIVCDATCLERNLNLALQTRAVTERAVLCLNLMDEAEKKQIHIDIAGLAKRLGMPVVATSARSSKGLPELMDAVLRTARLPHVQAGSLQCNDPVRHTEELFREAEAACRACVTLADPAADMRRFRVDRLLTGRFTGIPVMLLLLSLVFFITLAGANYPSALLSKWLFALQDQLSLLFQRLGAPSWLHDALVLGMYRVLAWVVSVMLPPMAIFFPLFTLLEDLGYLPRVAFNLDHSFKRCRACGKQALTMCMGFGCNAAGVIGCRIIDSPRERLIAMLTNNFVPCNGRFPTIIAIIAMFFVGASAGAERTLLSSVLLTGVIVLGVALTFLSSRLLSVTVLSGIPSSFTLELPPYRMPQIGKVLLRSVLDRTLFVLGRAVAVAAPAGLVLWLFANLNVGGMSILARCTAFLDPFARLFGLDGVLLMAFILGIPANEIVLPIALMGYMAAGSLADLPALDEMRALLIHNGWTWLTAVCTVLFSLLHWPCSTTLITIKKETGSLKWTALAFLLPTVAGLLICFLVATLARAFGLA